LIQSLRTPLAAFFGAITGVAAMALVQRHLAHVAPAPAASPPAAWVTAAPGAGDSERLAQLRLSALQTRLHDISVRAQPDYAPPPSPPDRTASLEQARHAFEQRLAEHDTAPRNAAWASSTERTIGDGLNKLAGDSHHSFALGKVDCRSTTCVARLSWPSESAARLELRSVLEGLDAPCARQIILPTANGAGDVDAAMWLDCSPPPPAPPRN
jgi:hypothetical protein